MPEAPNQTRIVNAALARLGSTERLSSIDDSSNSARRAKAVWDDMRRALLVRHPFNFAIKRVLLNAAAEAPAFGWDRQFSLPADCLRWLPPAHGSAEWYAGEREGDAILTNAAAPLKFRYIADVAEVPKWSPMFISAATIFIAGWINEGVTQSNTKQQGLDEMADKAIREAKRIDGLETGSTRRGNVVVQSRWLTARNRSTHGSGY